MESVIQSLVELDHKLFFFLNGAYSPVLDPIMKVFSHIYMDSSLRNPDCRTVYRFSLKKALIALGAVLIVCRHRPGIGCCHQRNRTAYTPFTYRNGRHLPAAGRQGACIPLSRHTRPMYSAWPP